MIESGSILPPIHYCRIGTCLIDFGTHRIIDATKIVRITPKATAVLSLLAAAGGKTISRDTLLTSVWPDTVPSDELLTQAISELRRALGDNPRKGSYIETIPKAGYRIPAAISPILRHEFEQAIRILEIEGPTEVPSAELARSRHFLSSLSSSTIVLAVLILVGLLAFTYFTLENYSLGPRRSQANEARQRSSEPWTPIRTVTAGPGPSEFPAISPDGSLVAYGFSPKATELTHIFVQTVGGSPPIQLTDDDAFSEGMPSWSRDGTRIAFLKFGDDGCQIVAMPALGGPQNVLGECMTHLTNWFDWSPDGQSLILERFATANGISEQVSSLHILELATGKFRPIPYSRNYTEQDLQPRFSPDGGQVAFRRGASPYSDIYIMNSSGGSVRPLTHMRTEIQGYDWLPDGHHILFSSNRDGQQQLYILDIDSGSIESLGTEEFSYPSVSRIGNAAVAVQRHLSTNLVEYHLVDQHMEKGTSLIPTDASDSWPVFSPVADKLVFVSNRSGKSQLWLLDLKASAPTQLSHFSEPNDLIAPQWSPKGDHILVIARLAGRSHILAVDLKSGVVTQESDDSERVRFAIYSIDGRWLYFVSDRNGVWAAWKRDLATGQEEKVIPLPVETLAEEPLQHSLIYTHDSGLSLFRFDSTRGIEQPFQAGHDLVSMYGWRTTPRGIYFLESKLYEPASLIFQSWDGREHEKLGQLTSDFFVDQGFSLAISANSDLSVIPVIVRDVSAVVLLERYSARQ